MAKSTQLYKKIPWTGGVNTSVDPGVLPDNDLVKAENVVFNIAGSRLKRGGLEYFDTGVRQPDFKSSSGTTRTLTWTTSSIYDTSGQQDDLLVVNEPITVEGSSSYNGNFTVATRSRQAQIREVVLPADTAGDLGGKYFVINEPYAGTSFYVWIDVDNGSTDPLIPGKTGVEVDISAGDSASTVASAVQAAVNGLSNFSASVVTDTVTITNSAAGIIFNETQPASGDLAATSVTITTRGEESITYTATTSFSESETASDLTISRNHSIIKIDDYWRENSSGQQEQLVMAVTSAGQIFKYDEDGNRTQVKGQGQITSIETVAESALTTGDYFTIFSANDVTEYYVWMNVNGGGGDPTPGGTGIEVAIASGDTANQVATKVASALNSNADFSASANTNTITVTNEEGGKSTAASDTNTGFTISTTETGATTLTSVDQVQTTVFNNRWIVCFSGTGNFPIMYRPESSSLYQKLPNAPDASIITTYLSRLWTNDKTDPHRIQYSETGAFDVWQGQGGDSAAIDIEPGDGDPEGIVAIYPFKSTFFVHKKRRTYRIFNNTPESFQVRPVNQSLGAESSYVVPIDNDDVMFVSRKGFHTIAATDQFGDTTNRYLSAKIQPTFESWAQSRLKYTQGVFIPELNSAAFTVAEALQSEQNAVWLYNVMFDSWYTWPNLNAQSVNVYLDSNSKNRLIFGDNAGRVFLAQSDKFNDFGSAGISYKVRTGAIYPGQDIQSVKAFRAVTFYFKPLGGFSFTVKYQIDNAKADAVSYSQVSSSDLLGSTFILGESALGLSGVLQPYTFHIDGLGRGITFEIEQTGPDEQVELYGYSIEYETEGLRNEVNE